MATFTWIGGSGGDWSTGSDWSGGSVPGALDSAIIALPGSYTVTISLAEAIQLLTLNNANATIAETAALTLGGTLNVTAGTFSLGGGGVIQGGTVSVATGAQFVGAGGTLNGVAFQGTLGFVAYHGYLTLTGATSLSGAGGTGAATINLTGYDSRLYVAGSATLNNAVLNIGTNNGDYGGDGLYNYDPNGTGAVLTLGPALSINQTGQNAYITSTDAAGDGIVNKGTINAGYSGGLLVIDATHFTNSGSIQVSGGDEIDLTGTISTTLINSIQASSGGGIGIGGIVNGGTITNSVSGEGGTLNAVAFQGTLSFITYHGYLTLTGATSLSGAGGTGAATINLTAYDTRLYVAGSATLNNAVLNIGTNNSDYGGDGLYNYDPNGTGAVLTLGPALSINQIGQYAYISSADAAGDAVVNQGTINAGYGGGFLVIDATHFTNSGSIQVSGGDEIILTGTTSTTLINSIHASSGGEIGIAGVVNGGTITNSIYGAGGTLNGVVFQGTLGFVANSSYLTLTGGTSLSGAGGTGTASINLTAYNSRLYVAGSATLNNAVLNIGTNNSDYGGDGLYNYDPNGTGAVLTLGPALSINQTGQYAYISSTDAAGDAVVNQGTINAGRSSGSFVVNAATFTNSGTLSASAGDVLNITGNFTNLSGTTLTGGSIAVNTGGTLQLGGSIVTLAANLTLGTGVVTGFDASFGTIAAGGTLSLLAGRSLTNTNDISDQGALVIAGGTLATNSLALLNAGSLYGYGSVTGPLTDDTLAEAHGGTLALAGSVTGAGTLQIDTGAVLQLAGSVAATDTIAFNGPGAQLQLLAPASFAATLANLGAGDVINLGTLAATSAVITGSTLAIGISGGAALSFALAGAANERVGISADKHTLTVYRYAQASATPNPVAFGNHHVGDVVGAAVTISNTALADGYSEKLDVTVGSLGAGISGSGSVTHMSAGAKNTTAISVGLTTAAAGAIAGSASLKLSTDGYGTDGAAALSIGTLAVGVTGAVYAYAAGTLANGGTVALGNHHVGDTVTSGLALTNAATANGYAEALDATLGTPGTGITASGSLAGLAAGGSNASALQVGLQTAATGAVSGTARLSLTSDGTGIDGLGTTALATQTVTVTGAVYAYATASLAQSVIAFGNHHVGDLVGSTLALTNTVASGSYSEALDVSLAGATAGLTASGAVSGLAAGAANSTALLVGLATGSAGAVSGTATLTLVSDGSGIDGLGTTALAGQTVSLSGAVFSYATAQLASAVVNFGAVHVGQSAAGTLVLGNAGAAGGYTEALDATLGSAAGIAASGSVQHLLAGGSDATDLTVGIATTSAGSISGTALLTLASDGAGIDGLGTTSLGSQTITVNGAVYAYAAGSLAQSSVAFGNHHVGDAVATTLTLSNTASGSYSEALDASLSGATAGVSASGSITGLAAGASNGSALLVGLATATAGAVSGTATLGLVSDGTGIDGLGTTALASQTVSVSGAVYNYATAQLAGLVVNLGVVHVGQLAAGTLRLGNAGAAGSYTEALDAAFASAGAGVVASGTVTGLLAGGSDTSDLQVGIATSSTGTIAGTAVLTLTSDGAGIDGLGTTALASQTISVSGVVDNYAVAAFEDPSGPQITGSGQSFVLNLGTVALNGAALTVSLGVLNAASGLSDLLGGTVTVAGGSGFTNAGFGSFAGLGAGQDEHLQGVTLSTSAAGTFTETVVLSSAGSNASGYSGALASETLTITGTVAASPNTYFLTAGPDSIVGAAGGDVFVAGPSTLGSHDSITGGNGANVLQLVGGGVFDLGAPKILSNVPTVTAYEGQAAVSGGADTRQFVQLRDGVAETLHVVSGTPAAGNANAETITIYGGTGADVIDLGAGSDLVVLGGTAETVNAGGGTATVQATAALAGAVVNGGTVGSAGSTVLQVTNAGTATLNNADTNLTVQLLAATHLSLGSASFITAIGSAGADTITAGGANQILTGGAGADTLIGSTSFATLFRDTSAGLNGDTIKNFGGSSLVDFTDLVFGALRTPTVTVTGSGATAVSKLKVTDGTHTATVSFGGTYSAASFAASSDSHGGTQFAFVPGH